MINTKNSFIVILSALLIVVVMTVPVFATTYYATGESPYYTVGDGSNYLTTNTVTVTLRLQSRRTGTYNTPYIDQLYTVTIPAFSTPHAVTVSEVLCQAMTDNSGLYFQDYQGNNISSNSAYCYQVQYSGNTYAPVQTGSPLSMNGWMFTINGKYPLLFGNPAITTDDSEYGNAYGSAINTTYVNNGDVITFYYDNPDSYSSSVDHLRIQAASYDPNTDKFTVHVESCKNWYSSGNATWHIMGYQPVQSATVKVYNSSNTQVAYGTTDSTGLAYLSATGTITSGSYKVVTSCKHKYISYLGTGYYFINQTHTEETLII